MRYSAGIFLIAFINVVKDYYAILGVPSSASQHEIKKAFRKLAIRYHPDKNSAPEARPLFHDINEAYDVLGDPRKRAQYDQRRGNPFASLQDVPVRPHRDPAYRRRAPHPQSKKGPPASWILMRDSLPYVMWISRVGLLVSTLFFVDYFLPYRLEAEQVRAVSAVTLRHTVSYHILTTASGREIKVYNYETKKFPVGELIYIRLTPVYGSVITVSNAAGTHREWLAYTYRMLIFFPIALFINSLLAFIYRKRVEFCFNLNVTAFVLLIITYILI